MKLKPLAQKIIIPNNLIEFENATKGIVYFNAAPFFTDVNVVIPVGKSHIPPMPNQLEIVNFIVVINTLLYPNEIDFYIDKQVKLHEQPFAHSRTIQAVHISAKNPMK